jgi:hypothetical protein
MPFAYSVTRKVGGTKKEKNKRSQERRKRVIERQKDFGINASGWIFTKLFTTDS